MTITLLPNTSQHDNISFMLHAVNKPLDYALVSIQSLLIRDIVREDDMYYFDLSLYGLTVTTNVTTESDIMEATVINRNATHVRLMWSQPDEPITQDKLCYKRVKSDTNAIFDAIGYLILDLFNQQVVPVIDPYTLTHHTSPLVLPLVDTLSHVTIKRGDLLKSSEDILVQQVNTLGKMGAGLAQSIRKQYPFVYDEYMAFCKQHADTNTLGRILWTKQGDSPIIANIFGQATIRSNYQDKRCHTNYIAVSRAIDKVVSEAKRTNRSVAFPFGFGSNLAGGDFKSILRMLDDTSRRHNQPITVYQLQS